MPLRTAGANVRLGISVVLVVVLVVFAFVVVTLQVTRSQELHL
jgi:hypothetical protein